jgi:hypothetical protein
MSANHKIFSIRKTGFLIDSQSIQAQIYPEIAETSCWIVTNSRYIKKVWEQINGVVQTKDMEFCHKCDRIHGLCANPNHIFLGTHKDNVEDMKRKNRQPKGSTRESALKAIETKRRNGTLYEIAKRVRQIKKQRGTDRIAGIKSAETKRKNGTLYEIAKRIANIKREKGVEFCSKATVLKIFETKRKNGTFKLSIETKKKISESAKARWKLTKLNA